MASIATDTSAPVMVTFPLEQQIKTYFASHPNAQTGFLKTVENEMTTQKLSELVAHHFASKQMSRTVIASEMRVAIFSDGNPKYAEVRTLLTGAKAVGLESAVIEKILSEGFPRLSAIGLIYTAMLNDCLDGATYTPPPSGEGSWTRCPPSV